MGKLIGEFLVEKGLITEAQIPHILKYSQEKRLRFGEAAIELKLFPIEKLIQLFGPNYKHDFFNLDPIYFPAVTKDVLSTDDILKHGALLMGFKTEFKLFRAKKTLNIGLLDPSNASNIESVAKLAHAKLGESAFQQTKVFLVLTDQFLDVLNDVYGIGEKQLRERPMSALDDTLAMFLESFSHTRI